jgi:hypothetical protein
LQAFGFSGLRAIPLSWFREYALHRARNEARRVTRTQTAEVSGCALDPMFPENGISGYRNSLIGGLGFRGSIARRATDEWP